MDSSPFNFMPGELRNVIWEYALHEPEGVPINARPGLLQTCRAIRSEAEHMFYAVNFFRAEIQEDNIKHRVCKWLADLGEARRKLIRGLQVHCVITNAEALAIEVEGPSVEEEEVSFMQLMHLLDVIRGADFGRKTENVVSFTVSSDDIDDGEYWIFDDAKSFDEMDLMSIEKEECYRAAKFLILCCVYGKEALVDAMDGRDGVDSILELDRRIQAHREEYALAELAALSRTSRST